MQLLLLFKQKIEPISCEKSQGCLQIDEKFINACLEKHNYYRDIHGVPPLKINDKVFILT